MTNSDDQVFRAYPSDIPALTSLRFVAAIWVVLFHYVWWLTPPGAPLLQIPILAEGDLAVDFFFILSGFILTHAHRRELAEGRLRLRRFYAKRLARIYPLHLATLLFYLALVAATSLAGLTLPNPERYSPLQFVLNLGLVHAWQAQDAAAWNFPSWSISAEWTAYMLFPLLTAWLLGRMRGISAATCLFAAAVVLFAMAAAAERLLGFPFFSLHSNFGWYRILPEFVLGIAMYRFGAAAPVAILRRKWVLGLIPVLILTTAALQWRISCVFLLALLILAVAEAARGADGSARAGVLRFLTGPLAVYGGTISFALYMVHIPVATAVFKSAEMLAGPVRWWMIPFAMVLAIVAAMLAHHLIEQPAYRWLSRRLAGEEIAPNLALERR